MDTHDEAWVRLLGADPRPHLLSSEEPAARWLALTSLLDGADATEVEKARSAVLGDPGTKAMLMRIPDWEHELVRSHGIPSYGPNLLHLLADIGVQAGDDPRIGRLLDQMLAHQEESGRFAGLGKFPMSDFVGWGAVLCDSHAVVETLVRFGRVADPGTQAGLARGGRPHRDAAGARLALRAALGHRLAWARAQGRRVPPGHSGGVADVREAPGGRPATRSGGGRAHRARRVAAQEHREAVHVRTRPGVQDGQVAGRLVRHPLGTGHARPLP
jgi:hypothetical protein